MGPWGSVSATAPAGRVGWLKEAGSSDGSTGYA